MSSDFASLLRRKARRAEAPEPSVCSSCHRVPLAGELLHELESHRKVCQLCLARLPAKKRTTVGSARVHVSERPLAIVVQRAA
jgi:hypothetical protein